MSDPFILADGRWSGAHGIGRFSSEVLRRLQSTTVFTEGPHPLSIKNLIWQPYHLYQTQKKYKIFFTPGFNPSLYSPLPFVFTIHDLIHLQISGKEKFIKKIYYELLVKPAIHQARKIITVSDYSKQKIIEWSGVSESKICVAGNGVSEIFTSSGEKYNPGYPYLLHVGNTKPHKNIARLLSAFSIAKIDSSIKLILTGNKTPELLEIIKKNKIEHRIVFEETLSEIQLACFYRGALALVFPSLYEGFGLPVLEAMASGTPVLTSNITSLPEVAGDAALLIDPEKIEAITFGIEKIVQDESVRMNLVKKGLERVKLFSWDKVAGVVQRVLDEI